MDFETRKKKREKALIMSIIVCVIAMLVVLFLMSYFSKLDAAKFKTFVNGKQVKIKSDFLLEKGDTRYLSVEGLASVLGYKYVIGDTENASNTNVCTISNSYISTVFTADSNKFEKTVLSDKFNSASTMVDSSVSQNANNSPEIYTTTTNVIKENDKLYVAFADVSKALDVKVENSKPQRFYIYELNYLYKQTLSNKSYANYSISANYEEARALVSGLLIYQDAGKWGIINTIEKTNVLNASYSSIKYFDNIKKLIVGIDGEYYLYETNGTIIKTEETYDSITILDQELELFIVEKNNLYGVINGKGDVVVYPDYKKIGIDDPTKFQNVTIDNSKLLLGNMIPVLKDGKWGAFDVNGNQILQTSYDTLGYIASSSSNTSNTSGTEKSLLIIPESAGVEGIVIGVKFDGIIRYGVVNKYGTFLIPCGCSKIFYRRESGKDKYVLYYLDQELDYTSYVTNNADVQKNAKLNEFEGKIGDGMSTPTVETSSQADTPSAQTTNTQTDLTNTTNTVSTDTTNTATDENTVENQTTENVVNE